MDGSRLKSARGRSPLEPATLTYGPDGLPAAPAYEDIYHPASGADGQARHVFLEGNGLPGRWCGRDRFVVLETGFGLGNNFLATWAAWRTDPARCARLWFVSVEKHPLRRDDLQRALAPSPYPELAAELLAAWPPLTPGVHRLAFDGGALVLQLVFDDVGTALRQLRLQGDATYLDGFAPARNPDMWDRYVLKAIGRLAAPGATVATWSAARAVREGLAANGFVVDLRQGFKGKREMTAAVYSPRIEVQRPTAAAAPGGDVVVIGAGLAGAACALALVRLGLRVTVIERHAAPAAEASGNPGGLFHGTLNPQDGLHARFNRAAALEAARHYAPLIRQGLVPGRIDGLLRLSSDLPDLAAMQALIDALGLPPDYVQALDAAAATQRSGLPLAVPAWAYAQGGWIDPRALVRHWLAQSGATLRTGAEVAALEREPGGSWSVLDTRGQSIAQAGTVVLCNAGDAQRLLGNPGWPLERQRGQLTLLPAGTPGLPVPRIPVAGGGYVLALDDGRIACGATAQFDDDDPAVREADQRTNLARLAQLGGVDIDPGRPGIEGRTAFRLLAPDRLPVVGAVPLAGERHEQPRRIPREEGLYVCTALASRGITWAPLVAELLAAWVTGTPMPLESSLVDALDPARFAARQLRRQGREAAGAAPRA